MGGRGERRRKSLTSTKRRAQSLIQEHKVTRVFIPSQIVVYLPFCLFFAFLSFFYSNQVSGCGHRPNIQGYLSHFCHCYSTEHSSSHRGPREGELSNHHGSSN